MPRKLTSGKGHKLCSVSRARRDFVCVLISYFGPSLNSPGTGRAFNWRQFQEMLICSHPGLSVLDNLSYALVSEQGSQGSVSCQYAKPLGGVKRMVLYMSSYN